MKPILLTSVSPMLSSTVAPPKAVMDMSRVELVEFGNRGWFREFDLPCGDATRFHSDVHSRLFEAERRGEREGLFDGLMWSDVVRLSLR